MAQMTIRLQCDPKTGKKDIIVSLESDEDLLPHEHEQRHRALVEKLIQGGLLAASDVGRIIVERDATDAVNATEQESAEQAAPEAAGHDARRTLEEGA